jgi:hypothetical protein
LKIKKGNKINIKGNKITTREQKENNYIRTHGRKMYIDDCK